MELKGASYREAGSSQLRKLLLALSSLKVEGVSFSLSRVFSLRLFRGVSAHSTMNKVLWPPVF